VIAQVDPRFMRVDGKSLVVKSPAELPPRCIKTNEPVDAQAITKTIHYAPPWVYVLFLIHILIGLLVYVLVRKACRITYYMTEDQRSKYWYRGLATWLILLGGFAMIFVALARQSPMLGVLSGLLILGGLVYAAIATNSVSIAKHRDGEFWIRGCGPDFLRSVAQGET
jgi:hypothetical protein